VFAVYDAVRRLQYVGFSRNIVLSVRTLRARMGADRVAHVRALAVANQAMQSRTALQRLAQSWIDQAGTVPPGNGAEAEAWGGSAGGSEASVDLAAMTAAERAEYEERRVKLEKAMGAAGTEAPLAELDPEERRARMMAAVEVRLRGGRRGWGGDRNGRASARPCGAAGRNACATAMRRQPPRRDASACERWLPTGRGLVGGDRRPDARHAARRRVCRRRGGLERGSRGPCTWPPGRAHQPLHPRQRAPKGGGGGAPGAARDDA
jgi:hypothetical protein